MAVVAGLVLLLAFAPSATAHDCAPLGHSSPDLGARDGVCFEVRDPRSTRADASSIDLEATWHRAGVFPTSVALFYGGLFGFALALALTAAGLRRALSRLTVLLNHG